MVVKIRKCLNLLYVCVGAGPWERMDVVVKMEKARSSLSWKLKRTFQNIAPNTNKLHIEILDLNMTWEGEQSSVQIYITM